MKLFYGEVLQNVTAWKPRAPRLPPASKVPADLPEELEEAVGAAEREMEAEIPFIDSP